MGLKQRQAKRILCETFDAWRTRATHSRDLRIRGGQLAAVSRHNAVKHHWGFWQAVYQRNVMTLTFRLQSQRRMTMQVLQQWQVRLGCNSLAHCVLELLHECVFV